jgi:lycopene cyclase domain-containing protein
MTMYLLLNALVIATLLLICVISPTPIQWRALWIVLGCILLATAIFDSLIISLDIVAYNNTRIIGAYIGKAPIEDFAYAFVAAFFVPYLWEKFGKK